MKAIKLLRDFHSFLAPTAYCSWLHYPPVAYINVSCGFPRHNRQSHSAKVTSFYLCFKASGRRRVFFPKDVFIVLGAEAKGNSTAALVLPQPFPPPPHVPGPSRSNPALEGEELFFELVGTPLQGFPACCGPAPLLGPRSSVPHPCPSTPVPVKWEGTGRAKKKGISSKISSPYRSQHGPVTEKSPWPPAALSFGHPSWWL